MADQLYFWHFLPMQFPVQDLQYLAKKGEPALAYRMGEDTDEDKKTGLLGDDLRRRAFFAKTLDRSCKIDRKIFKAEDHQYSDQWDTYQSDHGKRQGHL